MIILYSLLWKANKQTIFLIEMDKDIYRYKVLMVLPLWCDYNITWTGLPATVSFKPEHDSHGP